MECHPCRLSVAADLHGMGALTQTLVLRIACYLELHGLLK